MKFKKEEKEKAPVEEPSEWDEDERLCPECEGRGFIFPPEGRELCPTCDGLGVVYAQW